MAERVKLLTMLSRLENQLDGNLLDDFAVGISIRQLDETLLSSSSVLQERSRRTSPGHNLQRKLKLYRRLWSCKAALEASIYFIRAKRTILQNIHTRLLEELSK